MKKFYITNPETIERYAVYFDFEDGKFSGILGASYIMETGGNPITDNDDDAPTLDELKAQATSEIMDTDAEDEDYISGLCEAWGITPDEEPHHIEYALYMGDNLEAQDNDMADWFDTINTALSAAREAIENGETETAEIMAFDTDTGDCWWDYPITVDENGGAWSDDYNAREEMGFIQ